MRISLRKLFVTGSQCVQVETILVFRRYICEMAGEKCFLCPSVSTTQCELCDSKISHCEAHQRFHRPAGDGPCFPYLVSEVAGVSEVGGLWAITTSTALRTHMVKFRVSGSSV